MTINLADNSPRISYAVAQGATQTSFAVPFEFFASADLNVYVDGTLKTLTTHYTVSGGDGSTGTVTISVTGATGGSTVVITRDVALERTTDFPSSGPFQIGALNTELDRLTAIAADLDDKAGRALQLTDFDVAASLVLPTVDNRKGKTLAFNASSGAVEAGPTISDVQTVSAASADIQTLAHIEDGTDATDAIQTVAGIASNVSTVAGVSSAVSTVAGISSNVTAVAADATDIGVVAGKAAEIGRLGTAQAVADLDILATTDAVSDMNTLAAISSNISTVAGISANVTSVAGVASLITSDFVADLNTLATSDIVSDLNTLATADIVSDLNTLATSDIVSDLNTLATADIVSDLNTLATTDIVSDLNTLATTDIVTDLNLLATSAIVEDLNLLATSTVIADMATLAGAGANPNISSLGVSGTVTAGGLTVESNTGAIAKIGRSDTAIALNDVLGQLDFTTNDASTTEPIRGQVKVISDGTSGNSSLYISTALSNTLSNRIKVGFDGDISFYEDTGTTPKFFWDASAESLGIGTSSPTTKLQSKGGSISTPTDNAGLIANASASFVVDHGNDYGLYTGYVASANDAIGIAATRTLGGTLPLSLQPFGGNVGIGTSSPSDDVEISTSADGKGLTIKNAGNNRPYLNFDSNRSSAGNNLAELHFKWNGTDVARIIAVAGSDTTNKDDGHITFSTSSTGSVDERMRLDSSGNLLVGKTSADFGSSVGFEANSNDTVYATRSGGASLTLNRTTSDGDIALFRKNGSTVGIIGTNSGRFAIYGTDRGIRFTASELMPTNGSGTATDDILSVGHPSYRFKDLYLSGSIEIENGTGNVGVGKQALNSNTGDGNTALGFQASYSLTSGTDQVSVGARSGYSNQTSNDNTFIGNQAGYATTGNGNTFVGVTRGGGSYGAGRYVTTGTKNTIIGGYDGNQGGLDIRTSSNNIVLSDGDGNPRYAYTDGVAQLAGIGGSWTNSSGMHIKSAGSSGQYVTITNTSTSATAEALIVHRYGSVTNGEAIQFYRAYNSVGTITVSAGSTSYNTSSDYRLKENVVGLTGATERLKQLQPKRFSWIEEDLDSANIDGFLAHEVQSIVPEAITGEKDGTKLDKEGNTVPHYQQIDQSKLVPLLVATIKELEARITALENA